MARDYNRIEVRMGPAGAAKSVRRAVLAGLLAAFASPARGQAPVFPAESTLVTVDVVVLGPDGTPVGGLSRADFRVLEDGKEQAVTAFEAVETTVPALEARETTAARPSEARVATNVSLPATRRTFAIVFDDRRVGELNLEEAKRAVLAFARERTFPGDRLVLVTASDGRYWATSRGTDDAAWVGALEGVRSRRPPPEGPAGCRMSYAEALQIELLGNRRVEDLVGRRFAALCGPPTMRLSPEELARQSVAQDLARMGVDVPAGQGEGAAVVRSAAGAPEVFARARGEASGTLRVVREVVTRLGGAPGRKSLVLVSEGFPADPSLDVLREVREQAARANVAVHFLDARGLATGPEFLSAAGSTGLIPAPDVGMTVALWKLEDAGARALAEETGGRALQSNDLVAGLVQVAEESRVSYLLGYEPTNARRDGRYRRLKVEVSRPGVEVRARAGYFAPKGSRRPVPEPSVVDRVIASPFDADAIPLRLAAYVMGKAPLESPVPRTGVEVLLAGEVRLDALATREKAGRLVAEPRLSLLASSRSGGSHESSWTLEIALGEGVREAEEASAWHPFVTRIAMAPGDHRARLVVESGGRVGSVSVDFVVPASTEERLSTPVLSDRLVAGAATGPRVMPVVRRTFPGSGTLHAWVELLGAAVDEDRGQPRATAAFVARSLGGETWASGPATPMVLEDDRPTRLVSVPLAGAPGAENEIVLTVRDEVSGRTFEAREPFRVEPLAVGSPGGRRTGGEWGAGLGPGGTR